MILDYESMFLDEAAFDATPAVLDLGCIRPGPGRPLKVFASGVGVTDMTAIAVTDGATVGAATDALLTVPASATEMNEGGVTFTLPSETKEFVTIALTGITAGTVTAGIILDSGQTNK